MTVAVEQEETLAPELDPRRVACPACGEEVVRVHVTTKPAGGGRPLLVDHPEVEVMANGGPIPPGIYIAVDAVGATRPVRWPSPIAPGEAMHRPHQLSCSSLEAQEESEGPTLLNRPAPVDALEARAAAGDVDCEPDAAA